MGCIKLASAMRILWSETCVWAINPPFIRFGGEIKKTEVLVDIGKTIFKV